MRRILRAAVVLGGVATVGAGAVFVYRVRQGGVAAGVWYRLRGGHPSDDVDDAVLADRVRSSLGRLERRLDVPRIHVHVERGVVVLHGAVEWQHQAAALDAAVQQVRGVAAVESHLHVGLGPWDVRPSEGRQHAHGPSSAEQRLLTAAIAAGCSKADAPVAVRATLAAFLVRLPAGERDHVVLHLPQDVRAMVTVPRSFGGRPRTPRTLVQLAASAARYAADADVVVTPAVVRAVVRTLCELVPEESDDVAATLPDELRAVWLGD